MKLKSHRPPSQFPSNPRNPIYFNDTEQLSRDTLEYFIPNKKNNATFDSYLFHDGQGIGLQVTIAPTHSLNSEGLRNLRQRLVDPNNNATKPWLVAVVPKGQILTYAPPPSPANLKQLSFFKIEIELPDGVLLSLTWPLTLIVS